MHMHTLIPPLLSLLALTTASPILTTRNNLNNTTTGCTAASFGDFSWAVQHFDFHARYTFTSPSHQGIARAYVDFNISNPGDTTGAPASRCSGASDSGFSGDTDTTYPCASTAAAARADRVKTAFAFDRARGLLRFNQSWVCSDQDPQYPIIFTGYGAVNLTLDCTNETWHNANWTLGQVYSDRVVRCKPVDVAVKPFELTAIA
ncbi:hypothetical protein B0T22DRAFT_529356 [Podospora appendiculata]|uniref:AA1-like domain-containing protein n=1 Tax=Podospora appendiculata TaxID=314037 RepID=A0AAE0X517_9PEZI|nr:hypothetical protein B0T22DRAFT_529356 [Podospora appendiculata]